MPAYTEADWKSQFSQYERPSATDRRRFARYRGPEFEGMVDYDPLVGVTLQLSYWPRTQRDYAANRAQRLVDWLILQGRPLTAADSLVIVGGGWGYLGEALMALFPGLAAVSVELSQYVIDTADQSPNDYLIEVITAAGYDHTLPNSVGEYLYNLFQDPTPRATIAIAQEDLSNNGSRNRVRAKLPRDATHIITERVWELMTPTEQGYVNQASSVWGLPVTHILNNETFVDGTQ